MTGEPEATLFERIGGDDSLAVFSDALYCRIERDDALARFFSASSLPQQRARMSAFLKALLTGSHPDPKAHMGRVHADAVGRGLGPREFEKVAIAAQEILGDLGVCENDRNLIMQALSELRPSILHAPDTT